MRIRAHFSRRRIARILVTFIFLSFFDFTTLGAGFALPADGGTTNTVIGSGECQSTASGSAIIATDQVDGDCIVIFKSSSQTSSSSGNEWIAPANVEITFLVVGGGGSGGTPGPCSNESGGGGGGGLIQMRYKVTSGTGYAITVGGGGAGNLTGGANGSDSIAFGYIANGGGHGGGTNGTTLCDSQTMAGFSAGANGGSGGGGSHNQTNGGTATQSDVGRGRGFNGARPGLGSSGAGGGGAGGKGSASYSDGSGTHGGNGGPGFLSYITGQSLYYAGGGGGTSNGTYSNQFGTGGSSVGGDGSANSTGKNGMADRGSGGGGTLSGTTAAGGNGSAGIVVIRWTPSGFTNSLRMYTKRDDGATSSTTFSNAGKFYTNCSNTEDVFPYIGESTARHDWGGDQFGGAPAGCLGDSFTVFATGWIKAPASTFYVYTNSDDGSRLDINGTTYVNWTADQGPTIRPAANGSGNQVTGMVAGNWYRIDTWMHENTGGAYHELQWSLDGGTTKVGIPSANLTYRIPSVIASSLSDVSVPESHTVSLSYSETSVSGLTSITRQWQYSTNNGSTWANVVGGYFADTNAYLTISLSVANSGWKYRGSTTISDGFETSTSYTNAATISVFPNPSSDTDTALSISPSGGYAWAPDGGEFDITGAITLEAWVYPTAFNRGEWSTIINKGGAYELGITSSDGVTGVYRFGFSGYSNGTTYMFSGVDTGVKVRLNEWHHVAVTRTTAGTSNFYLDGEITYSGSADSATAGRTIPNTSFPFVIGARSSTPDTFTTAFSGKIDEVKVFAQDRSVSYIRTDIRSYLDVNTPDLVASYDCNEAIGSKVYNKVLSSSNLSDLTIVNGTSWPDIKTVDTSSLAGFTIVKFPRSYITKGNLGWKVPGTIQNATALVVGGGGAGGTAESSTGAYAGSGGSGGVVNLFTNLSLSGYQQVVVGSGGRGGVSGFTTTGTNGTSSIFGSNTASGGGYAAGAGSAQTGGASVGSKYFAGYGGRGASSGSAPASGQAGIIYANSLPTTFNIAGKYETYSVGGSGGGGFGYAGASTGNTFSGAAAGGDTNTVGADATGNYGNGGGGGGFYSSFGGFGGNGVVVVRWISIVKPIFTPISNLNITVGQYETFSVNMLADSATAGFTRTFKWESSTNGASGPWTQIKLGTGYNNTFYSWLPSDTSTSGNNYLFRVTVTDSDLDGNSISDSSTAYATISTAIKLIYSSVLTKSIGIPKSHVMTAYGGSAPLRYQISPITPNFWLDTSTVGSPILRILDTVTVGTYYETITVSDSNSATLFAPVTIIVSAPPSFSALNEIVDSGTVLYLDAANSASYPRSGTTWNDISGRALSANLSYSVPTTQTMADGSTRSGTFDYLTNVSCTKASFTTDAIGSFTFDGTPRCGNVSNFGLQEKYTVEMWVKRDGDQANGYSSLLANPYRRMADDLNINIFFTSTNLLTAQIIFNSTSYQLTGLATQNATWFHVCLTYDGATLKLMIDNDQAQVSSKPAAATWDKSKLDNGLFIAYPRAGYSGGNIFKGSIGLVRIYNRVLTASEITQNYNATKGRFLNTLNKVSISKKYGTTYSETYTVTAGSETVTASFTLGAISQVKWDTATVRSLKLTLQDSLTAGIYYDTITVTDYYGVSSYLPLAITVSPADTLTVSVDTATVMIYNGRPAVTYPKVSVKGLVSSDSATARTSFYSLSYNDSMTIPTNADMYTVSGMYLNFSSGSLANYINVLYETSTLTINKARQSPLNIFMYGGVVGMPFFIIPQGGGGTGAVTETLTGNSNIPGCSISNHTLYSTTTVQGYCEVRVVKAGDQNYYSETSTVQMYFMKFEANQPVNQVGSGPTIGINGMTSLAIDDSTTVTAPNILSWSLSGNQLTITGVGFGSSQVTVEFFMYLDVTATPTGGGTQIVVSVPVGAITGPVSVIKSPGGIDSIPELVLP